ncbi:MAG: TetR/AcrR family transcriptional regulator [Trueperaceae bacterium]|nr:TetR/AcrR family transcriptional regulator [Trueperaceae bacterium]
MSDGSKRGARRAGLTRVRIVRAAVALADERGLDALSMRALGRALGVEAMSLYNHVTDKDDVLDAMVDLVVAEIDVPEQGEAWRSALRRRSISARSALTRHPWAGRLIHTRSTSGPARLRAFEATIGCLRSAGFSHRLTVYALSTLDAYVDGFGAQRLNVAAADVPDDVSLAEALAAWLPAAEFPHLSALIHEHVLVDGYDEEASFAFGLDLVLDGLEERSRARER